MPEPYEATIAPLLDALNTLLNAQRRMHPALIGALKEQVGAAEAPLQAAYDAFSEPASSVESGLRTATELTLKAVAAFREIPEEPEGVFYAGRALRYAPYAMEMLYPAAAPSTAVSNFFLDTSRHADASIRDSLANPAPGSGVSHVANERGTRGGYSLYVPEYYDPARRWPVVFALHGGSGHGRAFLWTWLRDARSRGAILVTPTARGDTWALMGPDIDSENLESILTTIRSDWNIDDDRLLLTGMSDGGTFSYVSGLRAASPFTHLAPISAAFHPMMLELIDRPKLAGRPIYLTHGTHDWMFDIEAAQLADQILRANGADVVFREIPDLAHTYPRDENPRIMDWFLENRKNGN